ncbi:uncharacterized protein BXZ73DRAFT_17858, partial [Epithele typhae]|uniref:uncharacterized protein n=1 Tax=Epithele typhae TaxID=378194 RepID=UPI00200858AA
ECGGVLAWRCRTCLGQPMFCSKCCRKAHLHLVHHRVDFWDTDHWRRASLFDLRLQVHCGHDGRLCPSLMEL